VEEAGSVTLPSAEEARAHPVLWAVYASEGLWKPYPHLWWLADKVMDLLAGDKRFLAVSMPPGHGKSQFLSLFLPSFFLGAHPRGRVIQCSYAESLTLEWSRVGRDLLALHGPEVFGVEVPARSSAKSWDVFQFDPKLGRPKRQGYLRAVGRGGAITGKRMELGICDDLTKDAEEAASQAMRDKAWEWFVKVFLTRCTKEGKVVLVQTRWHHDDVIGRLQDRQARGMDTDGWEIVNLPAMAESDDPMGRAPGEPLCPDLFPLPELERIKARDAHTWGSLYQGRPTPVDGALYKREMFRYAKVFPDHISTGEGRKTTPRAGLVAFVTGDLAVAEKNYADFSCFSLFLADLVRSELFMVGRERGRMDGPSLIKCMRRLAEAGYAIHVEKTAYHLHLIQVAISQGIPVRMLEADRDKVSRAHPAVALFEAGRFYFSEGAEWLPEVEAELLQFPQGKNDDIADTVSYAARVFNEMLATGPAIEWEAGDDGDSGWWSGRKGGSW